MFGGLDIPCVLADLNLLVNNKINIVLLLYHLVLLCVVFYVFVLGCTTWCAIPLCMHICLDILNALDYLKMLYLY